MFDVIDTRFLIKIRVKKLKIDQFAIFSLIKP